MRFKKIATGIIVSLIVIAVLLAVTNRPLKAEGQAAGGDQEVLAKLDNVLKAQQEVMRRLDEMKEELKIIKIRVTQMQ